MNDDELRVLVKSHGATGKLVRAVCAASGWRRTTLGAPPEWYAAYRDALGEQLEKVLQGDMP